MSVAYDKNPGLFWKTSPLRINRTPEGYWAKGVLSVTVSDHIYHISYGACADDAELVKQKALSELVERIVWFITFIDLRRQIGLSDPYHTVGWAAHIDKKKAQASSVGEYLERYYFKMLLDELFSAERTQPYSLLQRIWTVAPHLYGRWDNVNELINSMVMVPLHFSQLDIHVVYVIAVCHLNRDAEKGVVFGMGRASSFKDAFYNARFELCLVMKALNRLRTRIQNRRLNNLAEYELKFFDGLYGNQDLLHSTEQLFNSRELEIENSRCQEFGQHIDAVPKYETFDFSWLQPKWLKPFSRYVYYTGELEGHIAKGLKGLYGITSEYKTV